MANRYWVGGGSSTNWNATGPTNWSGSSGGANNASAPGSADDVFFDANSGTGNSVINSSRTIRSLNCTGYAGTITHNAFTSLSIGDGTAGASNVALKFSSGMTYTNNSFLPLIFISTSTTQQTINWAGKVINGGVQFNGNGGSWIINDSFSAGDVVLQRGTLNTNGQTCSFTSFASSGTNNRVLTLGASSITVSAFMSPWNIGTSTNLTLNAGTSTITVTNGSFFGGSLTYHAVTMSSTVGPFILGSNTFTNLTMISASGSNSRMYLSDNQTVTGTLTITGSSSGRILIWSDVEGASRTITCNGTVNVNYADFMDIIGAGTASWDLSSQEVGDCEGNSGIAFPPSKTRYAVSPGNWLDVATWSATSGGSGGASTPLPQDAVRFDANSGGSSDTYTLDDRRIGSIDCTGASCLFTVTGGPLNGFGDVTLAGREIVADWRMRGRATSLVSCGGGRFGVPGADAWSFGPYSENGQLTGTVVFTDDFEGDVLIHEGGTITAQAGVAITRFDQQYDDVLLNMGTGTWELVGVNTTVWFSNETLLIDGDAATIKLTGEGQSGDIRTVDTGNLTGFPSIWVSAGEDRVRLGPTWTSCNDLNFTGFNGELYPNDVIVRGDLIMSETMTFFTGRSLHLAPPLGQSSLIESNGNGWEGYIYIDGPGTVILTDDLSTLEAVSLMAGTFDLNGKTLEVGSGYQVNVSEGAPTTRELVGPGTIIGGWDASSPSGFSLGTGISFILNYNTFYGGGLTYEMVTAQDGDEILGDGTTFTNLAINNAGYGPVRFEAGATFYINALTTNGTAENLTEIESNWWGNAYTLSKASGAIVVNYMSIRDSTATGGATWTAFNSINEGGNTGWIFAVVGQCSLSGAATLSSSSEVIHTGSAFLTGTGGQVTASTITFVGIADFTSSASLVVDGSFIKTGVSSLSGAATLTAKGQVGPKAELDASATLTVKSSNIYTGIVSISGTGGQVTVAALVATGLVLLDVSSILTAEASVGYVGEVSLLGSATLTAEGLNIISGVISLSGEAVLSGESFVTYSGAASISGAATLISAGNALHVAKSLLESVAQLSAESSVITIGQVSIQGTGGIVTVGHFSLEGPLDWTTNNVAAKVGQFSLNKKFSIQITSDGTSTEQYIYTATKTTISPNTDYIASIYLYNPGTIPGTGNSTKGASLVIVEYDSIDAEITNNELAINSHKTAGWERLILAFTSDSNTEKIAIRLHNYDRGIIWFDSLSLIQTSNTYETSFIEGANGVGYEFSGDRNESSSIRNDSLIRTSVGGIL